MSGKTDNVKQIIFLNRKAPNRYTDSVDPDEMLQNKASRKSALIEMKTNLRERNTNKCVAPKNIEWIECF